MPLTGGTHRAFTAKRITQDRQLLLHRPAPTTRHPANDFDPSGHTITYKTSCILIVEIVHHHRTKKKRQSAYTEAIMQGGFRATLTKKVYDFQMK